GRAGAGRGGSGGPSRGGGDQPARPDRGPRPAGEPTGRPDLPAQDERGERASGPAPVGTSRPAVYVPARARAGRHQLACGTGDPLRRHPAQGLGWQPDVGGCAGAVGADVGVAELLATGAFGLGLPESTPWRHGGSAGPASLTRVLAGACTNRSITRPDGRGASGSGPERRTRSYSRRGRHYGFSRYEVFAAGPATELVVRLDGRATG